MWDYDKKLIYPVRIANPDPAMAKLIITQLGGPDGELGAATRYLNQRYAQPYAHGKAILTDIGTEWSLWYTIVASVEPRHEKQPAPAGCP